MFRGIIVNQMAINILKLKYNIHGWHDDNKRVSSLFEFN